MRRMRCAYLTMDNIGDFVSDADLSFEPMRSLGWHIDMVSWRAPSVDWDQYDAVYLCTPWDYPDDAAAFMRVLETIDASRALLVNSMQLVRWSLKKTYLRELEARGAAIVPSLWYEDFAARQVPGFFAAHGTGKVVIKPQIGANAVDTFVLQAPVAPARVEELSRVFASRPHFVQPFMANIETEGEYSLFFFAGDYSHAIRKQPKAGDFRVQEEHGADILAVTPEPSLIETATQVVSLVEPQPVYVRADFVRGDDGAFLLMELEMIEPSLYLRTEPGAAARFARAFDAHVRQRVAAPAASGTHR